MDDQQIHPGHKRLRRVLVILGPSTLLIGIAFMATALGSVINAIMNDSFPRYFWCFFVGAPLLFAGCAICMFAFLGAFARYQAGEIAPVAKDTFNYMADGTSRGVETVARAVGTGLGAGLTAAGTAQPHVRCHKCNTLVDEDAKFCDNCGQALAKTKSCSGCGELNDPDARFCDNCGRDFSDVRVDHDDQTQ